MKEMNSNPMTILVTGANGQLGTEMRQIAHHHPHYRWIFTDVQELDICNAQAVNDCLQRESVNVVVNCAAYTAVDKAEEHPDLCDRLNHQAPALLAQAAEAVGAALVHISTDYVFDGTAHLPYREEDSPCPNSVYGRTKLAGEQEVLRLCSQAMIIRTAWLYSPYGNNFVKTMIRLGRERDSLGVVFDQIGTPTYAADLASAILSAIQQGIQPGIYHFSNEGVCSWYDFTLAIHRLAGITTCRVRPLHTDEYPALAPRPAYSVLDKSKIKQTYHLEIPHWEESLARCIADINA